MPKKSQNRVNRWVVHLRAFIYLKWNYELLYFIFISLKKTKYKSMNNFNSCNFVPQNPYFNMCRQQFEKNQILNTMSQALSISIYEYSIRKQTQKPQIQHPQCIQIIDQSNQVSNNFCSKQKSLNNDDLNQNQIEKKSTKKSQVFEESPEKEQSYTILSEAHDKNFSAVRNQKMEMEVENTMLDFVENPQILLGREEILSKKEKLLLRKVEFEKGNSKKRKYHGVGPQKRELKCLF